MTYELTRRNNCFLYAASRKTGYAICKPLPNIGDEFIKLVMVYCARIIYILIFYHGLNREQEVNSRKLNYFELPKSI